MIRPVKILHLIPVLLIVALVFFMSGSGHAAKLTNRSVQILSSRPSVTTGHNFGFDMTSSGSIGSIEFEYCDNDPFAGTACTAPAGLVVFSATLDTQTGEAGFIVDPLSTANKIILSRAPSAVTPPRPVTYSFSNIVNPAAPVHTVYVRISTFASVDATGPRTDEGAVAFATASGISVDGFVPPYITFCAGISVALDCSTSSGTKLNFGELSTTETRFLTSQFAGATNDESGYVVSLAGTTMTSGNNTIPALTSSSTSSAGTGQFGINLRANSAPSVGVDPVGSGSATADADYNAPNQFRFQNDILASSPISTDFNRFTVSYIINIPDGQAPGVYSTTLTYIAVASF